ncbi:MAG: type II toxin-antitoxin system VapC family toxin [Holosporales bacterium]
MIVVDTNILVYLALPSTFTEHAERLLVREPVWAAPSLWRSEFRNVLARYVQQSVVPLSNALALYESIEGILGGHTFEVPSAGVLKLAAQSGCTAYDCEYVALAQQGGMPLVTMDADVIKAFPQTAKKLTAFV